MSRRTESALPRNVETTEPDVTETKAPRQTLSVRLAARGLHHAAALALIEETDPSFLDDVRHALRDEDCRQDAVAKVAKIQASLETATSWLETAKAQAAKSAPVLARLDEAARKVASIRSESFTHP